MRKRPRKNDDIHNGFGEWGGYMDAKKSKLEEQFADDVLKNPYKQSDLFSGISIFVNGLTNPSADELKRIMMTHGGIYHTYQRSHTTFIIASNLPDVKIRQITSAKIISPQWIVDCLKENKILDYSNYLLYTNCKVSQPKITFKKKESPVVVQNTTENVLERSMIESPEKICQIKDENVKCENELKHNLNQLNLNIGLNLDILNVAIRKEKEQDEIGKVEKMEKVDKIVKSSAAPTKSPVKNDMMKKGHARTAVDPNFLSEFYNNSRLHLIATMGAAFKNHISRIRETHNGQFPIRDKLKHTFPKIGDDLIGNVIMHIDMDCFFVSVGLRTRPHLKGAPVAVTHSKGNNANNLQNVDGADRKKEMELYKKRHDEKFNVDDANRVKKLREIDNTTSLSEIASCSYEARKMGIKNGMFVGQALKLCPDLKTIPYDFDAYKEIAHLLYDTITQYTVNIEAVSCDEMYVNLTDIIQILECSVDDFVSYIRKEIIEKTQCPCSAGIGENKLQARMATKRAKPNGQFHLRVENVEKYFHDILISDLPGVGYSTTQKLMNLGLKTCADLQQMPLAKLQQDFGKKLGETLYENCRGIDNKPLTYDQVRKSVSSEVNYGIRFKEEHEFDTFLNQLCAEVHNRLIEIAAKGKTITLKLMVRAAEAPIETAKFMGHGFCDNITKSLTLSNFTSDLSVITKTIFSIKNKLKIPPHELRGIGIQISKLNTLQNNMGQKNTLKNLFDKVQSKQNHNAAKIPTSPDKSITTSSGRKLSIRKVKSFNGISTPNMNEKLKAANSNENLHKIYEELDLNVLAELPLEIRDEILRDKNRILNADSKITNEFQIPTMRKSFARKLENDFPKVDLKPPMRISPDEHVSKDNILNSTEWRHILCYWLENSNDPQDCDVQIISKYFKEFARAQRLSEMLIFLKYLHRKIEKMDCHWHGVYSHINQIVQHEVKNAFGSNIVLHVKDTFDCKKCINQ